MTVLDALRAGPAHASELAETMSVERQTVLTQLYCYQRRGQVTRHKRGWAFVSATPIQHQASRRRGQNKIKQTPGWVR